MEKKIQTQHIKDMPADQRPREKLLAKGATALEDHELLALVLGKGARGIDVLTLSRAMVETLDRAGLGFTPRELAKIKGMGEAKAASLCAAFEFVRRRIKPEGVKIRFPEDVIPLIQHYTNRKQEHFICITLNGGHEVLNIRVVTIGLVNKSLVHPREVFADALADRASAVILAHNHPSGNLQPSTEDIQVTERLVQAAEILGIRVLDHLVFSTRGFQSVMNKRLAA